MTTDMEPPSRLRAPLRVAVGAAIGTVVILGVAAFLLWFAWSIPAGRAANPFLTIFGLAVAASGIVLAIRVPQMEVLLFEDHVRLVGFFRSTVIPRASIQEVTAYPSIVWTDASGRTRYTVVTALFVDRSRAEPGAKVVALMEERIAILREWATGRAT